MTDKDFWESRWQQAQTGWDLKMVSPAIKLFIDTLTNKQQHILIPGCGNAHEAEYLVQQGFTNVTVIDIATTPTQQLNYKLKQYVDAGALTIICGDFFKHKGQYDLIIEQTFFCAINPTLRPDYAKHMLQLLKPEGKLVGLLFNTNFDGGPPFGGSTEEYLEYFKPYFKHISMIPCLNSIKPREGSEVWMEVGKKL